MASNEERHTVCSQVFQVVGRIIEYLTKKKNSECYKYPINNMTKQAAAATGKSQFARYEKK